MRLRIKKLRQNSKSGHTSVENFEIPGHPPSSRTDEIVSKVGQFFQEESRLKIIDICNI